MKLLFNVMWVSTLVACVAAAAIIDRHESPVEKWMVVDHRGRHHFVDRKDGVFLKNGCRIEFHGNFTALRYVEEGETATTRPTELGTPSLAERLWAIQNPMEESIRSHPDILCPTL